MLEIFALNPPIGAGRSRFKVARKTRRKARKSTKAKKARKHRRANVPRRSPPRYKSGPKKGQFKPRGARRSGKSKRACRPTKAAIRRATARFLKSRRARKRRGRDYLKSVPLIGGTAYGMNPPRRRRRRRRNPTGHRLSGKFYRPRIRVRGGRGKNLLARKTKRQRKWLAAYAYSNPPRRRRRRARRRRNDYISLNPRRRRRSRRRRNPTRGLSRVRSYWFNPRSRRRRRRRWLGAREARAAAPAGFKLPKLGGFKLGIPKVGQVIEFASHGAAGLAGLAIAFKLPEKLAPQLARIHPMLAKLDYGSTGALGSALATGLGYAVVKKLAPSKLQKYANTFLIGGAIGTVMRAAFAFFPQQAARALPMELQGAGAAQAAVNQLAQAQAAMKAAGVPGMSGYYQIPTTTARDIVAGERGMRDYISLQGGNGIRDYVQMGVVQNQSRSGNETF